MRLAAILLVGCYQPTVSPGIPCSEERACPRGQMCNANNRCELPGGVIDAPVDMMIDALGAWSAPKKLDTLNTMSAETDPTITADGLDIVFVSDRTGGPGLADLYRASRATISDDFGPPVLIAELSTATADNAPELTADGLTIYVRRSGTGGLDVFRAQRQTRTSAFDTPVREDMLSTPAQETNPAISRDGLTFSTTVEPSLTDRELVLFERTDTAKPWGTGRPITELSTTKVDSGAAFGFDGLVIVFHTDRAAPVADASDLYIATRPNKQSPFGPATPIAELNTAGNESDPTLTADLRYIAFDCDSDLCFSQR